MLQTKFDNLSEKVITREDFSKERALMVLNNQTIAVIGYGIQGPAQAKNLRDNGFNVIVGQRQNCANLQTSPSWEKAKADGFILGTSLFDIEDAVEKADIILYLLSDAGQIEQWPLVKKHLYGGKTLCFSHGFGITYKDRTQIIPPHDIDVVLVAPKGSGTSVRELFLEKKGINSSYAIYQDYTGFAKEKALALGVGIGSGYLFETTFKHEVYSDLVGERGVLMGALAGIIAAQYDTLRKHGHSPSEAFNETVEELTQSLMPLIAKHGMAWMYANCSTTAQRGALDWMPKFKNATLPLFEELYQSVASGNEAQIVIDANSQKDYREKLNTELKNMSEEEIWQVGEFVRRLRP